VLCELKTNFRPPEPSHDMSFAGSHSDSAPRAGLGVSIGDSRAERNRKSVPVTREHPKLFASEMSSAASVHWYHKDDQRSKAAQIAGHQLRQEIWPMVTRCQAKGQVSSSGKRPVRSEAPGLVDELRRAGYICLSDSIVARLCIWWASCIDEAHDTIYLSLHDLALFCRKHSPAARAIRIRAKALCTTDSDIDLLVEFEPAARPRSSTSRTMERSFPDCRGRRVDLTGSCRAISRDESWARPSAVCAPYLVRQHMLDPSRRPSQFLEGPDAKRPLLRTAGSCSALVRGPSESSLEDCLEGVGRRSRAGIRSAVDGSVRH